MKLLTGHVSRCHVATDVLWPSQGMWGQQKSLANLFRFTTSCCRGPTCVLLLPTVGRTFLQVFHGEASSQRRDLIVAH